MLSRLRKMMRQVLAPSTPVNDLNTVVRETIPDPHRWMSDAERRYHLNNQHGR